MTPAQAYGHPDFVTDVPVQGPTDEGIRAADCWWTQNVLPVKSPACADCNGPVPLWARNPTAWGGGWPEYGGNGGPNCGRLESVRYGSRRVAGFSLDGTSDPAATLTGDQQTWVQDALNTLNRRINETTGTSCSQNSTVGCFQLWVNANGKGSLRTDGVLDEDTLCALLSVAAAHPADFRTPFPNMGQRCYGGLTSPSAPAAPPPAAPAVPPPPPVTAAVAPPPDPPPVDSATMVAVKKYGPMVALGVASAIVVGGVTYVATRKKS